MRLFTSFQNTNVLNPLLFCQIEAEVNAVKAVADSLCPLKIVLDRVVLTSTGVLLGCWQVAFSDFLVSPRWIGAFWALINVYFDFSNFVILTLLSATKEAACSCASHYNGDCDIQAFWNGPFSALKQCWRDSMLAWKLSSHSKWWILPNIQNAEGWLLMFMNLKSRYF